MSVQTGDGAVQLVLIARLPYPYPTQHRSELPDATAIAMMPLFIDGLMACQVGVGALILVLRHNETPPASMVLGLFGSRMKGDAMGRNPKSSVMPESISLDVEHPSGLRYSSR